MQLCDINLAKGLVLSQRQRRRVYWLMLAYLAFSIMLLAAVFAGATRNVLQGVALGEQGRRMEAKFSAARAGVGNMQEYAESLFAETRTAAAHLESVSRALPAGDRSLMPLLQMLSRLPSGISLYQIEFVQSGEKSRQPELKFSLVVPAEKTRKNGDANLFASSWQRSPEARKAFRSIVPVTTERDMINGREVYIMKYQVLFKE